MSIYYELTKRPSQIQSNKCFSQSPGRTSTQNALEFLTRKNLVTKIKKIRDEKLRTIYLNPLLSPQQGTIKDSLKAVNVSSRLLRSKKMPVKLYSVPSEESQDNSSENLRKLIEKYSKKSVRGLDHVQNLKVNKKGLLNLERRRVEKIIESLKTKGKRMKDYEVSAKITGNLTISGWETTTEGY